jgi:hypothetical protein
MVPLQIVLPVFALIVMEGMTEGCTVTGTGLPVTVNGLTQTSLLVILQVTISPLFNKALIKEGLFIPVAIPLTFHKKEGVAPPLKGVAVKVIAVPEQISVPGTAETATDAASDALTFMMIALLEATAGTTQEELLVITQEIISPLINVDEE